MENISQGQRSINSSISVVIMEPLALQEESSGSSSLILGVLNTISKNVSLKASRYPSPRDQDTLPLQASLSSATVPDITGSSMGSLSKAVTLQPMPASHFIRGLLDIPTPMTAALRPLINDLNSSSLTFILVTLFLKIYMKHRVWNRNHPS